MKDKTQDWIKLLSTWVEDERVRVTLAKLIQQDIDIAYVDGKSEGMKVAREIFNPETK